MNPENTNQPVGTTPQAQPVFQPAPEKKGVAGVVLLVIIILGLLAGGYYLMNSMKASQAIPENVGTSVPTASEPVAQSDVDPNTVQGTSVSVSDIEKDLNATDLDSMVADLNAI
jgi:flagellar basal body-associated protein FliL